MSIFYCLLFGIFSFAFNLVVSMLVNGEAGYEIIETESGAKKPRFRTGLSFYDWLRVNIIALISALMGLVVYTAEFVAVIVFILSLGIMIYLTVWAVKQASEASEVVFFVLDVLIHFLICGLGVEAARAYKLRPLPGVAFIACVAVIIVTTLLYRANKADRDGESYGGILRAFAIGTGVIAFIAEVAIIIGMIVPAAH